MVFEVGRLCYKIAGRDAGNYCVVIKKLEKGYVLIDGQTRRRKCNVLHLEALPTLLKIKEDASYSDVVKMLEKEKIIVKQRRTAKKKEAGPRPKKQKKQKEKVVEEKRHEAKKEEPKKETKPTVKKEDPKKAASKPAAKK